MTNPTAFSLDQVVNACLALLAILNPITVVPMYAELTQNLDASQRRKLFNTAVAAAFITLLVLTFTGRWIMQFVFQIHVAEFRIAGGILLTVVAIKQIAFYRAEDFQASGSKVLEMGIVPMAVPLLVGPGAIVTSILVLDRDGWIVSLIALAVNFVIAFVVVRSSLLISKALGRFGTLVIARILWIFIGAIGVHFLITGISEVFGISLPIFK